MTAPDEPTDRQREEAELAGIYPNPDTPGYLRAVVGGGMGSFVSLCEDCAALVPNTTATRAAHTDWHECLERRQHPVVDA